MPTIRGGPEADLSQGAWLFKGFPVLRKTYLSLPGCFLNRHTNANLMTLANKNKVPHWDWIPVVPNNSHRHK